MGRGSAPRSSPRIGLKPQRRDRLGSTLFRLARPGADKRNARAKRSRRDPFGLKPQFERLEVANSAGGEFVLV